MKKENLFPIAQSQRLFAKMTWGPNSPATFFLFLIRNLMKLGEVVVQMEYYNITKSYQILMKNEKVLYIKHLRDGPSVKCK